MRDIAIEGKGLAKAGCKNTEVSQEGVKWAKGNCSFERMDEKSRTGPPILHHRPWLSVVARHAYLPRTAREYSPDRRRSIWGEVDRL